VPAPKTSWDGKAFNARVVTRAPQSVHMKDLGDRNFQVHLNELSRHENRRGQYYWHDDGGRRYCHYYDDWGYHWYGWWWGNDYYWTRYYYGRYWWYDNLFDRWCWWNEGYWWWQDPARVNAVYVYNDGRYVSPDQDLQVSDQGQSPLAPSGNAKKAFSDQTGSRLVKVFGSSRDAFLYDTSEPPAFQPTFLDSNAREAQFSYDAKGRTRQVVLYLTDGSVEVFDARGNSYQAPADN
jgi:hypothetical protein